MTAVNGDARASPQRVGPEKDRPGTGSVQHRRRALAALEHPQFRSGLWAQVDKWLEYTVGGLLVTIGVAQASSRTPSDRDVARRLGIGTAATLLAIDLIFVPRGRIRATYLQDAVCELAWLGAWATSRDKR